MLSKHFADVLSPTYKQASSPPLWNWVHIPKHKRWSSSWLVISEPTCKHKEKNKGGETCLKSSFFRMQSHLRQISFRLLQSETFFLSWTLLFPISPNRIHENASLIFFSYFFYNMMGCRLKQASYQGSGQLINMAPCVTSARRLLRSSSLRL